MSILRWIIGYLLLPKEISSFERKYLARMNQVAMGFFLVHVPAFMAIAVINDESPLLALGLTAAVLIGPLLAYFGFPERPRLFGLVAGFTSMLLGGVLVFIGQGPMQIEMHFYFFVLLALLAMFANPMAIMVAAATVAAHHLALWLLAPAQVFNYNATAWAVVVHTLFVLLESVAGCFVARTFFDSVFRLERKVNQRTAALDARNQDMTLILDNVAQGLLTVGLDGEMGVQQSRAMTSWFGEPPFEDPVWRYLAGHDPDLEAWMQLSFDGLSQGFLPIDVALAQLPDRIQRGSELFRLEYRPLGAPISGLLVVVSNITEEVKRQRSDAAQREIIAIVERAYRDRTGFLEFFREADEMVRDLVEPHDETLAELKRRLHTLKGNASMFGVQSVAEVCHALESRIEELPVTLDDKERDRLLGAWSAVHDRIDSVLGVSQRRTILVDWEEYQKVLSSIGEPEPPWASPIRRWGQVATRNHLERFAELARHLARRLGKGELDVEIRDHELHLESERFAPVWAALVHTVRNAVDHGLEDPDTRKEAGKPGRGKLVLSTELVDGDVVFEVRDDGRGFDWVKIAQRAREAGIPATGMNDLDQAVFAGGLSTADEVTDTSGRGVGMGALRAAVIAAGGAVELSSEPGQGATVRCRIPLRRDVAELPARRAPARSAQA
jgi:two-component system, chemotaxis family, sensor kinase CheA